jgi:hypothetical protein
MKALANVFFVNDQSVWNHYLGDFSPSIGKWILIPWILIHIQICRDEKTVRSYTCYSIFLNCKSDIDLCDSPSTKNWPYKFLLAQNLRIGFKSERGKELTEL